MAIARSYSQLRISSSRHSVADLTGLLGVSPTMASDRAEPVAEDDLRGGQDRRIDWVLQAPVDQHRNASEHLAWLAGFIDSRHQALGRIRRTASIGLFCFCEQLGDEGGFTLPAALLVRLGGHGLDVTFEIYSVSDAELDC